MFRKTSFHEIPASDHAAAPTGGVLLRRRARRAPRQPPPRHSRGLRRRVGAVPRRRGGGDPLPARRQNVREAARACEAQLGDETVAVREALRAFADPGTALIGMGSHQMHGAGGQLDAEVGYGLPVGARFVGDAALRPEDVALRPGLPRSATASGCWSRAS